MSCTTGHHGPLNARLCKIDDCHYRAVYSGRFWRVFPFRYATVLTVLSDDGVNVRLGGDRWLGPLSGTFTFRADATACRISACYSAKRDHGRFELAR